MGNRRRKPERQERERDEHERVQRRARASSTMKRGGPPSGKPGTTGTWKPPPAQDHRQREREPREQGQADAQHPVAGVPVVGDARVVVKGRERSSRSCSHRSVARRRTSIGSVA